MLVNITLLSLHIFSKNVLTFKFEFVFSGGIAFVWYTIWTLTVADTPELDKFITEKEKIYIGEQNKQFFQATGNVSQ